jgi:putative aldouronate transport system substrate-binding protein
MKRFLSISAALMLFLGLFAGCGNGNGANQSAGAQTAQASDSQADQSSAASQASAEPSSAGGAGGGARLQLIMPSNVQDFPEGVTPNSNFIVDFWKSKTGDDYDVIVLPTQEGEQKLNLMFSSGEVTGMVFSKDQTSFTKYYEQGLLQPLDSIVGGSSFFSTFEPYQATGILGGQQYAAIIPPDGIPAESGLYIVRKDLASENGFAEQPQTFEAFNSMLEAFKGTGRVALSVYGSPTTAAWDMLQGLFGVNLECNSWAVRDGSIAYRPVLPEALGYIKYVKRLYDEELIPKDFVSLTEDAAIQLYLSDSAASLKIAHVWPAANIMPQSEESGYDSRFMDYPTGATGEKTYGSFGRLGASQGVYVSKLCTDLGACSRLLDTLIEQDTLMVCNYGIEGEHYTIEGNSVVLSEAGQNLNWAVYFRNVFMPEDWYPVYGINANWAEFYYPSERHTIGYTDYDPVQFMALAAENVALERELMTTIVEQYYVKAVTGEIEPTEETFNAMVEDWKGNGGQSLLDSYTQQWKDMGSPDFSNMYISYLPESHPEYTGKYLWDGKE